MCEPATLAIIGTVVATAGTAVNGYMGYKQAMFESKVQRQNARLESERAAKELDKGADDRKQLSRKYSAMSGAQRAAMAANGIDVEFGSAGDLQSDTAMLYREDTATAIRNNADTVRGIDINAANYRAEAQAAKSKATGIAISTAFDMGSTILGGVGKVKKIGAARAGGGSGWGV